MSVCNINLINISKCSSNCRNIFLISDFPYPVGYAIRCGKIIKWCAFLHLFYNIIDYLFRTIGKENRSGLGTTGIHMGNPVNFLIFSCILMLFYNLIHIIIYGSTSNKAGLGTSIHNQFIGIICLIPIFNQSAVFNHSLKQFFRLFIHPLIIGIDTILEVCLCPVNFQKRQWLFCHLCFRFLPVIYIIW